MSTVYEPTAWGYMVAHDSDDQTWNGIPPLISRADFNKATGNRWSTDTDMVDMVLAAVSQAVRNFCGWHIAPNLPCLYIAYGLEGKIAKLPSMMVTECDVSTDDGSDFPSGIEWQPRGLVRRDDGCDWPQDWGKYAFEFSSGYESDAMLSQIIVQVASNHMAAAPGIREEQAGAVRLSYNQMANGVSGGVTLLDREQMLLAPYRLQLGVV